MANFPSFTFTTAGRAAITRSLSGKDVDRLIITKCVLGDGVYSGGIETLKDVTSPKMTVTVSEYTDNGDGTSVTRFVYDNASLDAGFYHREMGIYAKNGDVGTELLLCYSNAGNQYSYIKAGTVDSVTKQRKATIPPQTFKFVLATGGSGSVNAVIDPKGYVDVEMLEEHNTDPTAHEDIRQKFNDYATKTGTGASGTWGINISGNAATATKATQDGSGNIIADTYIKKSGDTVTGTLNIPTPDATDNSTKAANTAFVQSALGNKVSQAELNNAIDIHNTDPDAAHENRFRFFQKIATLGEDVIKKLALTTTITVITALQTNSWFGQLLKMVLNASGVKYSMGQNGYICLGGFFGGLIIQWIRNLSSGWSVVQYPIAMTATYAVIPVTISNGHADRSKLYKYYPLVSTYNTDSSECWLEGDSLIIVIGQQREL